jgi:DNA replication protein DnaC
LDISQDILSQEAIPIGSHEFCNRHNETLPCHICAELNSISEKQKQSKILNLMPNANIGKRYHLMNFADYQPLCKEAVRVKEICTRYATNFSERLKGCDNLLMVGNPGTGKNMLAACICKEVMGQGFSVLHTTAIKIVRRIKECWSTKSETETQSIKAFSSPDLLVIDEVGVQFGSKTEEMYLFEVVNERYEDMRPTILISNLTEKEIENFLGIRTMDRFCDGKSMLLKFDWESWRKRKS